MATHSSTLAWKIPWPEEPGRLQSMGVTKNQTLLSDFSFIFHFHALEKEMETHSSVLAWRIPEDRQAWWAAVYGVAQSRTRLKRLSSSSSRLHRGLPPAQTVKNLPASAGDLGSIPGPGRSPGEGNGNPLQYSCLENSIDRGVWQARSMGSKRIGHD